MSLERTLVMNGVHAYGIWNVWLSRWKASAGGMKYIAEHILCSDYALLHTIGSVVEFISISTQAKLYELSMTKEFFTFPSMSTFILKMNAMNTESWNCNCSGVSFARKVVWSFELTNIPQRCESISNFRETFFRR